MPIREDIAGRVLVVTLDNPRIRNAFDKATIGKLRDLFETLSYRDPLPVDPDQVSGPDGTLDIGTQGRWRPQVVVLQAAGDVFCAGAHLGEMQALGEADYQENLAAALDMGAMFRAVRNCPAPVVARVQGPAFGGGVGLVAACDIVVADDRARFAFSEVRLGIVPGVIAPLVIDRIGRPAARTYFLTGESLGPVEAYRLGLVDRLAAAGDLDAAVELVVRDLLKGGPAALGRVKSLLEGAQSLGFARSGELTARMIAEARAQPEAQAALKEFLAKKPAPWVQDQPWTLPAVAKGSHDPESA